MPAPMIKTKTPGIFRRGSRYVVVYRDAEGKQRKESAGTLDEARKLKAARTADVARGEFHVLSRERFKDYASEWIERYQGTGRRGFRDSTRDDYRRLLKDYAFPFFDDKLRRKLHEVTPADVARFIAWVCDEEAQGRVLADSTVRNALAPVRACFATAVREGKVRSNPCANAALPHRERADDDGNEPVRAMTREQLATLLAIVPARHRLLFRFLAVTGVRISELIALQWKSLHLDGSEPEARIRRAYVRGRFGPPKSRHGRRDIPLPPALVFELRAWKRETDWPGDDDLVFPSTTGNPRSRGNMWSRVLAPAAQEAGVPWVGFHTFRHTRATLMFAAGANAVQVQRMLGHHSPSFTLATYVHLLPEDRFPATDLDAELSPRRATPGVAARTATAPNVPVLSQRSHVAA